MVNKLEPSRRWCTWKKFFWLQNISFYFKLAVGLFRNHTLACCSQKDRCFAGKQYNRCRFNCWLEVLSCCSLTKPLIIPAFWIERHSFSMHSSSALQCLQWFPASKGASFYHRWYAQKPLRRECRCRISILPPYLPCSQQQVTNCINIIKKLGLFPVKISSNFAIGNAIAFIVAMIAIRFFIGF